MTLRGVTDNLSPDAAELLADLELVAAPRLPGPTCAVAKAITGIRAEAPTVADRLVELIDGDVEASRLAEVLTRHGHRVQSYTVRRHRKRSTPDGCRCPR